MKLNEMRMKTDGRQCQPYGANSQHRNTLRSLTQIREIKFETKGSPFDPWMTQDSHLAHIRQLRVL